MIKTIKLPISISDLDKETILNIQKNQNSVIRFTYNRLQENKGLSTKQINALHKKLNNIFVDSHFLNSATFKAKELSEKENIIFGGKKLFIERCQNKISKEEFRLKRLLPIISIGEALQKSNRKFKIINESTLLFKPSKQVHIDLQLPKLKKKLKKEMNTLILLQESKQIPITYQLSTEFIWLSYEDKYLNEIKQYQSKENRIMSLDLNPNYIGYSICDWKHEEYKLVDKGVFDLSYFSNKSKELKNLKYELKHLTGAERRQSIKEKQVKLNNKRTFETIQIAIKLFNIFKSFNCKVFGIEKLSIHSSDKSKGKGFNRLVNNEWLHNALINQLKKRIDRLNNCRFLEINPEYSSFIGNLLYRNEQLPDMVLSSLEINRRSYEFYNQYILKSKEKEKSVIFPIFEKVKERLAKSLEEFSYSVNDFKDWISVYREFKKSKVKYRFPLNESLKVFSKNCLKSKVFLYAL